MKYRLPLFLLACTIAGCTHVDPVTVTAIQIQTGREQTLHPVTDALYQGTELGFTAATLSHDPAQGWLLLVYDYSDTTSPLYPAATFAQITPDADNPAGPYARLINGKPDQHAGLMHIAVTND